MVVSMVGVLVFMVFAEISVRVFMPEILPLGVSKNLIRYNVYGDSFANNISVHATALGKEVYTDGNGFRIDPHGDYAYKKGKEALFFVGDSVIFGYGVSAEKTFVERVNKAISNFRVVNAGMLGYNLRDYRNFIDHYVLKNKEEDNIRYVVLGVCLNDSNLDLLPKSDILRHQPRFTQKDIYLVNRLKSADILLKWNRLLRRKLRLYLLLKSLIEDTSKRIFMTDLRLHIPFKSTYQEGLSILRHISEVLLDENIKLKIILFPYEYQLRTNTHLEPQREYKIFFIQNHIEYMDLYDYLHGYIRNHNIAANKLFLFNDAMHFSEVGHKVISKYILNNL